MDTISIVIADDHPLVRLALSDWFTVAPGFAIAGAAADGATALEMVQALKPHVLVTDLTLRGMSGLEVIRRIAREQPQTQTVVFSIQSNPTSVTDALRAGAGGYVLRVDRADTLVEAVRSVAAGTRYVSAPLRPFLVAFENKERTGAGGPYRALTERERAVLRLVARGMTTVEVSIELGISARTVETHRSHLMRKLRLKTRVDLIRFAIQAGLLDTSSS